MLDRFLSWFELRYIFILSKDNLINKIVCKNDKIDETQDKARYLMRNGWFLIEEPNFANRLKTCDEYPELQEFNLDPFKDDFESKDFPFNYPICSW